MNKNQLSLMGKVTQLADVHAYEESQDRVRILKEDSTMSGRIVEIVQEFGYGVEKINGYSDRERKDGYVKDFVASIEIVAKPQE